jgi:hypothetical protein
VTTESSPRFASSPPPGWLPVSGLFDEAVLLMVPLLCSWSTARRCARTVTSPSPYPRLRLRASPSLIRPLLGQVSDLVRVEVEHDLPVAGIAVADRDGGCVFSPACFRSDR